MEKMLAILFAITTLVCARGWFCSKVQAMTALRFIYAKADKLPTLEELEACRDEVLKEMLRIK